MGRGWPPLEACIETVIGTPPRVVTGLEGGNALCLQSLRALLDFEFNRLPFVQGLVPVGLDRRAVHENVLTRLALDEPVALGCVKPLDCTLLSSHFPAPNSFIGRPLAGTSG